MVKTAVSLGKGVYQTSLKINACLAFTNNVRGLHKFTVKVLFSSSDIALSNRKKVLLQFGLSQLEKQERRGSY